MGVTLGRRVIKGGEVKGTANPFNLGASLANKVDTFIGIAGANWGLATCYTFPTYATCSALDGFYPGFMIGPVGLSTYLKELNDDTVKEGDHTFALLSTADDLIMYGDLVFGKFTSEWPTLDATKIYKTLGHMDLRDKTKDV